MIQRKVDKYLKLYAQYQDIKGMVEGLKEDIQEYMVEHDLTEVGGLETEGKVILRSYQRPGVTSKYTAYSLDKVLPYLTEEAKEKCVVNVVDKDAVEALVQLGMVSEDIEKEKNTTSSYRLMVEKK